MQASLYAFILSICVLTFACSRSRTIRQIVLLAGSYILFLSWGKWFAAILAASTVVNFFVGKSLRRKCSTLLLWIGIVFNLGLLSSFKYLPDLASQLSFPALQRFAHVALPLGISFWTFQAMSYLFDLYRGEELDPSFIEFALYMVFFPVVVAGPICQLPEMLPQFRSEEKTSWRQILYGLQRIAIGLLMMQAARLLGQGILSGDGINSGFDHSRSWSAFDVWCLSFGFGAQLFLDFAGYSHIAIGAAKALGFTVPENFSRPFESTSPSIFWTRWHMSLSFWIRDYLFLPLATLRREIWWRNLALIAAMVTFGVWHKATWLFVMWGAYHGVLLVLHRQIQQAGRRFDWTSTPLWNLFSWATTFAAISLGWIFFRANSLEQARAMMATVFHPAAYSSHVLSGSLFGLVGAMVIAILILPSVIGSVGGAAVEEDEDSLSSSPIWSRVLRNRWVWVPPLYIIALLFLMIVTHTQSADPAQLMYRNF
jgi:alginate O-acetyltransferase complex protein AlgI